MSQGVPGPPGWKAPGPRLVSELRALFVALSSQRQRPLWEQQGERSTEEKAAGPRCLALADLGQSACRCETWQDHDGNDPEPGHSPLLTLHQTTWKAKHLNLSSECLVYSRDLKLQWLPEPSREHKWVKSARRKLPCVRRASTGERTASSSDRYVQHWAAVWGKGPNDNTQNLWTCQEKLKIQTSLYNPSF